MTALHYDAVRWLQVRREQRRIARLIRAAQSRYLKISVADGVWVAGTDALCDGLAGRLVGPQTYSVVPFPQLQVPPS